MPQAAPPPDPPATAIVVTGRALPDPAAERAYGVETIGTERLHNSPTTQLDEILKQAAGAQLFRRSDARSAHPTSHGVTLRALGGNASSRALLMLDGVPQSDPFGGWVNWPAYDPTSLAEVRVIRGGGSVTQGPGALAGVIELSSSLDDELRAAGEVGSRQSVEARLHVGAALGPGRVSISGRAARGDGFVPIAEEWRGPADEAAPYREASLRARWIVPLTNQVEVQLSGLGFTDRRERGLEFTRNRTDGADAALRLVGRGRWQWSALAYVQRRELSSSFASVDPARSVATRVALQDEVPSRAAGASFELRPPLGPGTEVRIGADLRVMRGQSRELFSFVSGDPTRRRVAGGESATGGLFGEATLALGDLVLSGGARFDRWQVSDGELREWTIATGAPLRDERYGSRGGWLTTGRAGAVLDVGRGMSLRAAAYLGWRLPTLNELFRPFRVGADATAANPDLDPERLAGAEAGVRYERSAMAFSLTGFANRLTGAIANVTLGQGPGVFPGVGFVPAAGEFRRRQNLDAVVVRGIEAAAEAARGPWSVRMGASLTDAEVNGDGPSAPLDGLRPAQTPQVVFTAGVGWERGKRAASLLLRHSGQQFEDDLNQRVLPAATTVDGFAAWPLTPALQLAVRAENLFDERVVAGIGADRTVERATPRTIWIGIRFASQRR